jgi:hypothetical protein
MRKLSIFVAAFVTILLVFTVLPTFIIYLIGCYQIGSWVGDFIRKKIDEEDL